MAPHARRGRVSGERHARDIRRRPTVIDAFGDDLGEQNFALANHYYASREAAASEILERLRVRYVVSWVEIGYLDAAPALGSMALLLHAYDGSQLAQNPSNLKKAISYFLASPVTTLTTSRR